MEDSNNDDISVDQLESSNLNVNKKKKRYRILSEDKRKIEKIKNKEDDNEIKRNELKKKSPKVTQDELKQKLLKIILGNKKDKEEEINEEIERKNKFEKIKQEKIKNFLEQREKLKKEKNKENEKEENLLKKKEKHKIESFEEGEKIYYETSFNFNKSRLTKIKFRNFETIQNENISEDNNKNIIIKQKKRKSFIKVKKVAEENLRKDNKSFDDIKNDLSENLNINKEKKKNKKTIKKKIKKKKKEKNSETSETYESNEKTEEESSSAMEEKLSKSVQENNFKNNDNDEIMKEKDKDKDKEKENQITLAKKELLNKLAKKIDKIIFETNDIPQNNNEINLNININNPLKEKIINNNYNNYIYSTINTKNEEKKENKNNEQIEDSKDSLIKSEEIVNYGLVKNTILSYKERKRREKLERDLIDEINNNELTDRIHTESQKNLNIKKSENDNEYISNTRRNYQNIINLDKEHNEKYKKNVLNNSLINLKKLNNSKNCENNLENVKNRVYTPKKASLSKDNKKVKKAKLKNNNVQKENNSINSNNISTNNNYSNPNFEQNENEKKTKFKIFNENCLKNKNPLIKSYNNRNDNLEFNESSSMDYSSIVNKSNISELQKYNLRHNKILYIKKSPPKNCLNKTDYDNIDYNEKSDINLYCKSHKQKNESPNGLYIHTFNFNKLNKNKIKKVLINRFNNTCCINNSSGQNVSYQSNDFNTPTLNESNNDYTNNAFVVNNNNIFNNNSNNNNSNKNIYSNSESTKSFKFGKQAYIITPQETPLDTNLEELILLENKYYHIIQYLGDKKEIANDCFDLLNFFYNSSLYQFILKFFSDTNILKLNINYTLMSLLVSYDLSFEKEKLKKIYLLLLEMFILNYRNLMLITEFITNRVNNNNLNSLWINRLVNKIIKYKESQEGEDIDSFSNFGLTIIEKIKYNTHYLMEKIHYILLNYEENNNNNLLFFLKTINANSYDKISIYFKENIIRENLGFSSLLASSIIKNNSLTKRLNQPKDPYIPYPSKKKYSLVLDLEETLVYFNKIKSESNGTLKIRPGTFSFLEKVKKYFEIIVFCEAEENFVELVANSIEENKKYFDYKLYRQHTDIQNEEFIKDLSKIGRKLSNIIIVDNMPQNFRLQPENGIYIKPFWGTDNTDDVLFFLSKILCKIASEGGDVRDGIKKYRKEIIINVSFSHKDN